MLSPPPPWPKAHLYTPGQKEEEEETAQHLPHKLNSCCYNHCSIVREERRNSTSVKAMAFAAKGQFFSSSIWPVLFSLPPPFLPHPPPPDTKESERAAAAASGSEKRASIQSSGAVSSGSQKRTAFVIVVVECVCTVYCPFLLSADVLGPSIGLDRGKERAGGGCIAAVVLVLPLAEWGDFPIPRAYIRRQGSNLETLEQATKSGPLPLKAHRGLLRCPGKVIFGPQRALWGRFWEHISWSLLHTVNVSHSPSIPFFEKVQSRHFLFRNVPT